MVSCHGREMSRVEFGTKLCRTVLINGLKHEDDWRRYREAKDGRRVLIFNY